MGTIASPLSLLIVRLKPRLHDEAIKPDDLACRAGFIV